MRDKLKNKIVLVTGGAGFIGSHLCEKLINNGARVICFDNLSQGRQKNIKGIRTCKDFLFLKGDCNNYSDVNRIFKKSVILLGQVPLKLDTECILRYPENI